MGRVMGRDIDQRALEPLGIGMAEFQLAQFLQVIVQQPGMVERGLKDQRLAQGNRDAVAAMHRARRQLLAHDHIRHRPALGSRRDRALPIAVAAPTKARFLPVPAGPGLAPVAA